MTIINENNWIFTYSPSSEEIRKWFESGKIQTTVEKYLSERCFHDRSKYEPKDRLHMDYKNWCTEKGIPPLHQNVFHKQIKNNKIIPVEQYRPRLEDGTQQYAWKGLWLIPKD